MNENGKEEKEGEDADDMTEDKSEERKKVRMKEE